MNPFNPNQLVNRKKFSFAYANPLAIPIEIPLPQTETVSWEQKSIK